jgi:hypothetical protein
MAFINWSVWSKIRNDKLREEKLKEYLKKEEEYWKDLPQGDEGVPGLEE